MTGAASSDETAAARPWALVVVSPHLDDAVLSCGGRLAATTAGGGRALVVTLFAGDEPSEPRGALARKLRRAWKLPDGGVLASRRAEDLEACRRLGAVARHGLHREALYREQGGEPLYPTLSALFGEPAPDDLERLDELVAELAELPPAELTLAPLAIGGHVDHRLTRRAAELSERDVAFYEDFPYVEWKRRELSRALADVELWEPDVLPLADSLLERRAHAIEAYASQVPMLFRSPGRLRKQLRRAAQRAGGERVWRRRSTPRSGAR